MSDSRKTSWERAAYHEAMARICARAGLAALEQWHLECAAEALAERRADA